MATDLTIYLNFLLAGLLFWALIYIITYRHKIKIRKKVLLQEKNAILGFIHNVGEVFADSEKIEMNELLTRVLHYAVRTCRAGSGAIYLLNRKDQQLYARAISGVFPPPFPIEKFTEMPIHNATDGLEKIIKSTPIPQGSGLLGESAAQGNSLLISDAEMDARVPDHINEFLKIKTMIVVPMRFGNHSIGVMTLVNRTNGTPFTTSNLGLAQALAAQAAVPVHYADMQEALEQKQQLDRDMRIAQQIQSSLLPSQLPIYENIELSAFNYPALEIGGDYYDFVQIDDNHIGLVIADVSGKGVGGALMMAVCRSVLRANALNIYNPAGILTTLNEMLSYNLADDMFISMLYMIVNTETCLLSFARAGHEPPILIKEGKTPEILDTQGIAIGLVDNETFESVIEVKTVALKPGDTIVTYTDGITEAMDSEENEFGMDRFLQEIIHSKHNKAEELLAHIQKEVRAFSTGVRQHDDMTMLALKIK